MTAINDRIRSSLVADYGPGNLNDLLRGWMTDVGIDPWSSDQLRAYLLDETGASASLATNDLLALYFDGSFDVSDFRLTEDGFHRLTETGDLRLLEE